MLLDYNPKQKLKCVIMQKEKKDEKWKKKLYFNRNYFMNACCHFVIFYAV